MIPHAWNVLSRLATIACVPLRLLRRSPGVHAAPRRETGLWLPPTPMPELAPLPEWRPRVAPYVPAQKLTSEWLSREYAILYSWAADMERKIYGVTGHVVNA